MCSCSLSKTVLRIQDPFIPGIKGVLLQKLIPLFVSTKFVFRRVSNINNQGYSKTCLLILVKHTRKREKREKKRKY